MAEVEGGKGKAHTHRRRRQQAVVGEAEVVPTCIMTAAEDMTEAEEVAGELGNLAEAIWSLVGVGTEAEGHQGAAGTSPALSDVRSSNS